MKGRKFKKLISIMLCLFIISFIIASSFINVSAATYFKPGNQIKLDASLDFPFGEFGVYGSNDNGMTFVFAGDEFPDIETEVYFDTFGFAFSWYPNVSRNVLQAGSNVALVFNMTPEFGQWFYDIKHTYGLDPAEFFSIRVSPNALGNPNQWTNGTYYYGSTLVRPKIVQVINNSTPDSSYYKPTQVRVLFETPIETGSIFCEFQSSSSYGINMTESFKSVEFGKIVTALIFKVSSIDQSVAELGQSKGDLNAGIAQNDQLTSDLSGASDKVDEMIDKDAAVNAMDPSKLDIGNVISSDKYSKLSIMLDNFWDSLGAELNFVLMFTLVVGLAIYLLGKKAKS